MNRTYRSPIFWPLRLFSLSLLILSIITACGRTNTPPFGSLDVPQNGTTVSGTVQVIGWALDQETPTASLTFTLLINGNPVSTSATRPGRLDVCEIFPERTYPGACRSGVQFEWNTTGLNGPHTIAILVTDSGGLTKTLGPRKVTVTNKKTRS